jgi:hypothetical protein
MKLTILAMAAGLTASVPALCASAAEPAPAPFDRRAETWSVRDLIGLSEAQLREKLGVTPSPHTYLSRIELTDDGEHRILRTRDQVYPGDNCGEEAIIGVDLKYGARTSSAPQFEFTDGKLTAILNHDSEAPGPEARLGRACVRVAPGLTLGDRATYVALLSPLLVLAAPMIASDAMQESAGKAALDDFRLGETPPGGLAAYAKPLPPAVQLGRPVDGRQVLTVTFQKASKVKAAWTVRVLLKDGRVVGFEKDRANPLSCALLADGEMRCDMPPLRKVRHYPPT